MQVQQPLLLAAHVVELTLNVARAGAGLFVMMRGPRDQCRLEPFLHRLGLTEAIEQRNDLLVDLLFPKTDTRMIFGEVSGAAVVDVALAARFLGDDLSCHGASAMAARDEFTRVGEFMA